MNFDKIKGRDRTILLITAKIEKTKTKYNLEIYANAIKGTNNF